MTSSSETKQPVRSARRGGFTIVELLVVISIIVLIIGITLPVLVRARKTAARARMGADLQTITQGLEAYRGDFKDYPRIDYSTTDPLIANANPSVIDRLGAVTLCWALLAPGPGTQDGNDGPGFRIRGTQGQVYGPYIHPDNFNITGTTDWDSTINDTHGNPYLYFPGNKGASINSTNGFAALYNPAFPNGNPAPMYNLKDNTLASVIATQLGAAPTGWAGPTWSWQTAMQNTLGDTNCNGMIDPNTSETPATTGSYLLWCAGPDELWGTSDDVTNFTQ